MAFINGHKVYHSVFVQSVAEEQGGLIYSTTLSEAVQTIRINTDNNENGFSLSDFTIALKVPASASLQNFSYLQARIVMNEGQYTSQAFNCNTVIGGGTEGKIHQIMFSAAIRNMRWEYEFACIKNVSDLGSGDCSGTPDKKGYTTSNVFNGVEQLKCNGIILATTNVNAVIPVGTTIEVYGK